MANGTKKTGARFNIFDILILFAILASIAAIGVRAYFLADGKENVQTTRVEFVVRGVSEVTAQKFAKQYGTLYLDSTDAEIGTIISATYSQSISLKRFCSVILVSLPFHSSAQGLGS